MLNVENRFMLRDLYRQGVSISELARRTGHDRKTIRNITRLLFSRNPLPRSGGRGLCVLSNELSQGVFHDELLPGGDLVAHQHVERLII